MGEDIVVSPIFSDATNSVYPSGNTFSEKQESVIPTSSTNLVNSQNDDSFEKTNLSNYDTSSDSTKKISRRGKPIVLSKKEKDKVRQYLDDPRSRVSDKSRQALLYLCDQPASMPELIDRYGVVAKNMYLLLAKFRDSTTKSSSRRTSTTTQLIDHHPQSTISASSDRADNNYTDEVQTSINQEHIDQEIINRYLDDHPRLGTKTKDAIMCWATNTSIGVAEVANRFGVSHSGLYRHVEAIQKLTNAQNLGSDENVAVKMSLSEELQGLITMAAGHIHGWSTKNSHTKVITDALHEYFLPGGGLEKHSHKIGSELMSIIHRRAKSLTDHKKN